MITKEEMERKIAEVKKQQKKDSEIASFGKSWWIRHLAISLGEVNRGEAPGEEHNVAVMCYQQFMGIAPKDGERPVTQEKDEANKD